MKKLLKSRIFALGVIVGVGLLIINLTQAQITPKGKPPQKPRCNYNGLCEERETSDCPDCFPSLPLQLNHFSLQIVSGGWEKIVFHIKYLDGGYQKAWNSSLNEDVTRGTTIGDFDNDGMKEIMAFVQYSGRGKNPSYRKAYVYEDGSTGTPSYISPNIGYVFNGVRDAIIADANNDGFNEIIVALPYFVEVWRWNGVDLERIWRSEDLSEWIWRVDVGDANNDNQNEIVLAMFGMGSAIIYEHLGGNIWGNKIITQSIGYKNIDEARVRDADNDGLKEIVAGGTSNKLNIWEYQDGNYVNVFMSDDLGGYTQGVDVGDVDGDGKKEIIVGTSGEIDKIYIFKYNDSTQTYEIIDSISVNGVGRLSVGDLDKDGRDEIVSNELGITVYEYEPNLKKTYDFPYGGIISVG